MTHSGPWKKAVTFEQRERNLRTLHSHERRCVVCSVQIPRNSMRCSPCNRRAREAARGGS